MATNRKSRSKRHEKIEIENHQEEIKTYPLNLSNEEIIHLRDLMSILLPPDGILTLSQSLANSTNRSMLETKIWVKLTDLCKSVGIPTDDAAPDFAIGMTGMPTLTVYQLQSNETTEK